MLVGLISVAVATYKGARPFDMFSIDVHSSMEIGLALTLSFFIVFHIIEDRSMTVNMKNPFVLYLMQLIVSFVGTASAAPVLIGTQRSAARWRAFVSFFAALWTVTIWLSTDVSLLQFFEEPGFVFRKPYDAAGGLMASGLSLALFATSFTKVAYAMGYRQARWVKPYHARFTEKATLYARRRLTAEGVSLEAPVPLPAALWFGMLSVFTVVSTVAAGLAFCAWRDYEDWAEAVVNDWLRPLQRLFILAGAPLPLDQLGFFATKTLVCFYISLFITMAVSCWLMYCVLSGYRRLFRNMVRGEDFHGKKLYCSVPDAFQAKWATYFAGALLGNIILAFLVVLFLSFIIIAILTLPQFWQAQWNMINYWIFYGLLYVTRYCVFRFVIPRHVVTDNGVVVKRRIWAIIYPTLTMLNLILGATSGILRSLVVTPYMLLTHFRIDVCAAPELLSDWDWAYQPFLCMVIHSYQRLNPNLIAAATEFAKGRCLGAEGAPSSQYSLWEAASSQAPATPRSRSSANTPGLEEPLVEIENEDLPGATRARLLRHSQIRNRWRLAITLARNPSLRSSRKHNILAASTPNGSTTERQIGCLQVEVLA
eukprot:TRINITY_DN38968_c0_g1_i2.p1 TRINITY_DN38968_c0_g1~~TRINITY_DN38968_c0_g1_i2.p1  ORF type:complete len:595 (+),score=37.54 TRINITY_DN38968_c0_g1_i2:194-1978(+)